MVQLTITCPRCGEAKRIGRHGVNRSGTVRYRCWECMITFAPEAKPKGLPVEKERLILNALKEGYSYAKEGYSYAKEGYSYAKEGYSCASITRTFNCSFSTVYALLKKGSPASPPSAPRS